MRCQYKLYLVILPITVFLLADAEDDYYLAKVLFFTDIYGKILIISGTLPSEIVQIITDDLHRRLDVRSKNILKVVPAFDNVSDIIQHENVLDHLEKQHQNVQKINLSLVQSRRIIEDMVKPNLPAELKPQTNEKYIQNRKGILRNISSVELEDVDGREFWHNYIRTTKRTTRVVQTYLPGKPMTDPPQVMDSSKYFVPNEIYYGVEKRCTNWADECKMQLGSLLSLPVNYFKIPAIEMRPPPTVRWMPRHKIEQL